MLKFNEEEIRKDIQNVLACRPEVEKVVDSICSDGYENLILLGIGGTYAASMELESYMRGHSSIPVYLENAADLLALGNTSLTERSLVLVTSVTGNTIEMVKAVDYVHERGAKVIGFIDETESPLAKAVDFEFCAKGSDYFEILLVALRLMKNAGEFPQYEQFYDQIEKNLGTGLVEVEKKADKAAEEYAKKHCDDEMQYVIGAGNLWGAAYSYAMCYMEEMLWMRTKSISASEFFHGTLEVIERDSNVMIFMGEDEARVQTDRVYAFVKTICNNITVFDTKEYHMEGIDDQFRGILSPVIMAAIYARINVQLEEARKHPMDIRRYYRRLKY